MVLGDGGPSICKDFNVTFPEVQHRFDGKDHAFLEGDAGPWFSIVEDLRILMKFLSDAMATEFADDRKSMLFGVLLNGMTNVPQCRFRLDGTNSKVKSFLADFGQSAGADRNVPDQKHLARVAVIPILNDGDVDVDDITTF